MTGDDTQVSSGSVSTAKTMPAEYVFRLYVSGVTHSSLRAVVNTRKLFEHYLKDRYQLEILNVSEHVAMALSDQVIATPTLVKVTPLPLRRFIGDVSKVDSILLSLNLRYDV